MSNIEEDTMNIFDKLTEHEFEETTLKMAEENNIPNRFSHEWSDYILSLFEKDELREGAPTCDGLRRIFQQVIGPILNEEVFVENPQPNFSAVEFSITFYDKYDGQQKTFADAADVHEGNTETPYSRHATAVATTRAESRVLRKALGLRKVLSAEEMSGEIREMRAKEEKFDFDNQFVDQSQLTAINLVCKRLDLDVWKTLNRGEAKYTSVDKIPSDFARETMKYINTELNGKEIPKEMQGYNPNWQSEVNFQVNEFKQFCERKKE